MSREEMPLREHYNMPRSVNFGGFEGYRDDYYVRVRRNFGEGYPPDYYLGMQERHYPEEYYPYSDQRFAFQGDTVETQREPKFSNESSKWDRSNAYRRNPENCLPLYNQESTRRGESSGPYFDSDPRKQLRLGEGPGGPSQQSIPSSQIGQLSVQEVESGVRITRGPDESNRGVSVFHTNGKDSIWTKIDHFNAKKLCYECQKAKWMDKITPLCKDCFRNLSDSSGKTGFRKECVFCRVEFLNHRIMRKAARVFNKEICLGCCKNMCKYNIAPVRCHFCDCWSAWTSHLLCDRCSTSREQFGEPLPCDMCRRTCAFDRGEAAKKKLDGRLLCFLCTFKYKKLKYEEAKRTNQEYRKAEKTLTKVDLAVSSASTDKGTEKSALSLSEAPANSVDWKTVAEERMALYEKAKQHLSELQAKEISNKLETGSLISQLNEANSNLEKQNKSLEDKLLQLKAEVNDWHLRLNNICDDKNKQIKLLKEEKRLAMQEMEEILEKLKAENKELKEKIAESKNQ